jgi:hypothetical protein
LCEPLPPAGALGDAGGVMQPEVAVHASLAPVVPTLPLPLAPLAGVDGLLLLHPTPSATLAAPRPMQAKPNAL